MKVDPQLSAQLDSLLEGTLDPNGEAAVLRVLACNPAARQEFARLVQLHAWLATDDGTRAVLKANGACPRRCIIPRRAWWLAAAVAAAIIVFAASRLLPASGLHAPLAGMDTLRPMLHAACSGCHGSPDRFFTGNTRAGLAMIVAGSPEQSALWVRLSGDNPCARSLDASGKLLVRKWIAHASVHGVES